MTVIIVAAVVLAAVYLLRPLFTAAAVCVTLLAVLAGGGSVSAAPASAAPVSVGLLLVAVDARRDHVRVSEALRISNTGPVVSLELRFALPEDAQYATWHRGLDGAVRTADGFVVRLRLPTGLTEVAYSYALATTTRTSFARAYPLPVRRMEIVARRHQPRGKMIRVLATRGQAVPPLVVAGEMLARWELRNLHPGDAVTVILDGLPVSLPWLPPAAAGGLAAALAAGLVLRLTRPIHLRGGELPGPQNS